MPKLGDIPTDPATVWTTAQWYGGKRCRLQTAIGTRFGITPACRRCLSAGSLCVTPPAHPQATSLPVHHREPVTTLPRFVYRWGMETTF
jgi:hypothetical protein